MSHIFFTSTPSGSESILDRRAFPAPLLPANMARTAWAQLKFELDGVYHSLRSNTLKERKSAREQLLVLTDDAGHRHFLARGGPRQATAGFYSTLRAKIVINQSYSLSIALLPVSEGLHYGPG